MLFLTKLHIPSDELIHKFLYNNLVFVDKHYAYFGADLVDLQHFKVIYQEYILRNFQVDERNFYKLW
jgi:hypothetical protein